MQFGIAILAEAGLSFLGVGIEPPAAAWGSMVNDGYKYLLTIPALSIIPGITIMLVVFAFNMVGDGLRDALDPRLLSTAQDSTVHTHSLPALIPLLVWVPDSPASFPWPRNPYRRAAAA